MRLPFAALLISLAGPTAAQIQITPSPIEQVTLIPGWRDAGGAHIAAIDIRLAEGWHTYWRAPGATGIPPHFDWSASGNVAAVSYQWPRPIVFDTYGSATIGYKNELVLPMRIEPATPGAPIDVDVQVFLGVCKDICIPAEVRVTGRLDAEGAVADRNRIKTALATGAVDAAQGGVTAAACALGQGAKGAEVRAQISFSRPPSSPPITVIEAPGRPDIWIGESATRLAGGAVVATARISRSGQGGLLLDRSGLRITVLDGQSVVEIEGCPARE